MLTPPPKPQGPPNRVFKDNSGLEWIALLGAGILLAAALSCAGRDWARTEPGPGTRAEFLADRAACRAEVGRPAGSMIQVNRIGRTLVGRSSPLIRAKRVDVEHCLQEKGWARQ